MDMVITSAPSEAMQRVLAYRAVQSRGTLEEDRDFAIRSAWTEKENRNAPYIWEQIMKAEGQPLGAWSTDPLRIPDRTRKCWEDTHPLAQIDWTADKNRRTDGNYIHVVRALKWWRRRHPKPKYPKGYPLEALIGDACPDGITSVAQGVVDTLEKLVERWEAHAAAPDTPYIKDHGVNQNVLSRISPEEFADFHALLAPALKTARLAMEAEDKEISVVYWQDLFGPKFPDPRGMDGPDGGGGSGGTPTGGFTPRHEAGLVGGGRFG
jgi:hypothetical protein